MSSCNNFRPVEYTYDEIIGNDVDSFRPDGYSYSIEAVKKNVRKSNLENYEGVLVMKVLLDGVPRLKPTRKLGTYSVKMVNGELSVTIDIKVALTVTKLCRNINSKKSFLSCVKKNERPREAIMIISKILEFMLIIQSISEEKYNVIVDEINNSKEDLVEVSRIFNTNIGEVVPTIQFLLGEEEEISCIEDNQLISDEIINHRDEQNDTDHVEVDNPVIEVRDDSEMISNGDGPDDTVQMEDSSDSDSEHELTIDEEPFDGPEIQPENNNDVTIDVTSPPINTSNVNININIGNNDGSTEDILRKRKRSPELDEYTYDYNFKTHTMVLGCVFHNINDMICSIKSKTPITCRMPIDDLKIVLATFLKNPSINNGFRVGEKDKKMLEQPRNEELDVFSLVLYITRAEIDTGKYVKEYSAEILFDNSPSISYTELYNLHKGRRTFYSGLGKKIFDRVLCIFDTYKYLTSEDLDVGYVFLAKGNNPFSLNYFEGCNNENSIVID